MDAENYGGITGDQRHVARYSRPHSDRKHQGNRYYQFSGSGDYYLRVASQRVGVQAGRVRPRNQVRQVPAIGLKIRRRHDRLTAASAFHPHGRLRLPNERNSSRLGGPSALQPHDPEHIEPPVHRTQDAALDQAEEPAGESRMPQDRLSRLSQAILSINQEPDPDAVLQRILEGARSLTGARHGAITVFDASGGMQDFITSGSSPERPGPLGHLNQVAGPVRLSDIASHSSPVGFPENHPPMKTFLGTPIRHHGEPLGNIHLTEREGGREFTPEDKETLAMFASQAALVITNARRYREQEQAKADLEEDSEPLSSGDADL